MNNRIVLFHLHEAAEELNRIIADLEQDSAYDTEEFSVAMGHLYHHLNTAWNGRDQTDQEFNSCTGDSFRRLRRFPPQSEFPGLEE